MRNIAEKISKSIGTLVWRRHARVEAEEDGIGESGLEDALRKEFKLVEHYPDDPYGESALVLIYVEGKPVHVVLSPRKDFCYLITAYLPNKEEWSEDFLRRKK
jgi:hypothetical protein